MLIFLCMGKVDILLNCNSVPDIFEIENANKRRGYAVYK